RCPEPVFELLVHGACLLLIGRRKYCATSPSARPPRVRAGPAASGGPPRGPRGRAIPGCFRCNPDFHPHSWSSCRSPRRRTTPDRLATIGSATETRTRNRTRTMGGGKAIPAKARHLATAANRQGRDRSPP